MKKRLQQDLRKYGRYSVVSAKAQLKAEVASSYLNWLWWVFEPTCFMLIYTFIFGTVFQASEPYFPIFIFIGISAWDFFHRTLTQSIKIVKKNKAIVTKVYLPKYILILTKIWVNGFKMLLSFGVVFFMILLYGVPVSWRVLDLLPFLLLLVLFTFGCSAFLLHYGVFVEDLSNVVNIVLRLLFYLTGIFYHVESRIPAPYGTWLTRYNPMAFILTGMRRSLLYGEVWQGGLWMVWLGISLLLSLAGIGLIYKNENRYIKVI